MNKTNELDVRGTVVRVIKIDGEDYVCLTDMAKLKSDDPSFTINHWMRNRMTIEYLGLWEELYNPNFKPTEFGRFREESGLNSFTLRFTFTNTSGHLRCGCHRIKIHRYRFIKYRFYRTMSRIIFNRILIHCLP